MNVSIEISSNTTMSSVSKSLDIPMNIRPLSPTQLSYFCIIIVVGTLINSLVIAVISYSRQLHYPRHLFWAAISIVNQCCILSLLLKLVTHVDSSRVACQLHVLNAGVFYTIVLTFLAMTALDRYLAISRYEWYMKKVTNRGVIYVLLFAGFVTYAAITSPFWTGFKTIKTCTINLTHMHYVMIYNLLLGFLSVILHIMIFFRSRKAALQQPRPAYMENPIALQFLPAASRTNAEKVENPPQRAETVIGSTGSAVRNQHDETAEPKRNERDCFNWFYNNRPKISRLEIRAATSMSINVLPVWLCTFPVTLNAIAIYWCFRLELNCPFIFKINPYILDFFVIHFIYNPFMYMLSSTEFKRALIRVIQKCKPNTRHT